MIYGRYINTKTRLNARISREAKTLVCKGHGNASPNLWSWVPRTVTENGMIWTYSKL